METKRFVKEWMCEVLLSAVNSTGFRKIYVRKNYRVGRRISEKKSCYEKFSKIVRNFIKKSLHQRCFPLNLTKFFRAAYSESTHEQLLLTAEKNKPKCKTLGTIEIDGHKPRNILGYFKISKTCDFLFIDEIFLRNTPLD